jgi:hypothetical protein
MDDVLPRASPGPDASASQLLRRIAPRGDSHSSCNDGSGGSAPLGQLHPLLRSLPAHWLAAPPAAAAPLPAAAALQHAGNSVVGIPVLLGDGRPAMLVTKQEAAAAGEPAPAAHAPAMPVPGLQTLPPPAPPTKDPFALEDDDPAAALAPATQGGSRSAQQVPPSGRPARRGPAAAGVPPPDATPPGRGPRVTLNGGETCEAEWLPGVKQEEGGGGLEVGAQPCGAAAAGRKRVAVPPVEAATGGPAASCKAPGPAKRARRAEGCEAAAQTAKRKAAAVPPGPAAERALRAEGDAAVRPAGATMALAQPPAREAAPRAPPSQPAAPRGNKPAAAGKPHAAMPCAKGAAAAAAQRPAGRATATGPPAPATPRSQPRAAAAAPPASRRTPAARGLVLSPVQFPGMPPLYAKAPAAEAEAVEAEPMRAEAKASPPLQVGTPAARPSTRPDAQQPPRGQEAPTALQPCASAAGSTRVQARGDDGRTAALGPAGAAAGERRGTRGAGGGGGHAAQGAAPSALELRLELYNAWCQVGPRRRMRRHGGSEAATR